MSRQVWITGLGATTAFGLGMDTLMEGLRSGQSAAAAPQHFDLTPLGLSALAELRDPLPDVAGFTDDRKVSLLYSAAREAMYSAALPWWPDARRGVFLGTGLSSVTPDELRHDLYPHLQGDTFSRPSLARDLRTDGGAPGRHLPARAAASLALDLGAGGAVQTSFAACAASAQAIIDAMRAIQRGELDCVIAGGHDSMCHPFGVLSFLLLGTLCHDTCRPFDKRRSGFLLGEGAAVLVLEAEDAARARGAPPLARLLGGGTSVDAHAITAPHPDGLGAQLAMARALADAGVAPASIDQINAHGTGTMVGDRAEALAISRLFPGGVPVASLKGALGHTIAAAGAVELAASVRSMNDGFMLGTVGYAQPDPACPIQVARQPVDRTPGLILSNSFGFGGQNAAIVVAHPDFQR